MRIGSILTLLVCLIILHAEDTPPPDVLIPVGAMVPATIDSVLQIQAGAPGMATLRATGPCVAGAGPMTDIPFTLTGAATASLSTGRIEIDIQQVVIGGVAVAAKGYVIDQGDTSFGIRAQVAHVAPGSRIDPTTVQNTTAPTEDQIKVAVPHLVVAAGAKLQVVFFSAVTLPGASVAKAIATRPTPKPETPAPAAHQPAALGRTIVGQPLPPTPAP